ncbi:MAG: glycine cleavage system aminomethyltransferase GcvT [Tissierellia bacterium]|nr:glycine cleavage system aminomethyltransferase GcvT [Tissierellia bacterium]
MSLKRTPLYNKHKEAGADVVEFFGWEMPMTYTKLEDEHLAVRQAAGLFDVSHMGEIYVEGPDSAAFMKKMFTNDLEKLEDGAIAYGFFLTETGGIVDDLLVYRRNKDSYLLVVNASNCDKDDAWLRAHEEGYDIVIDNRSDDIAEVAIQGPKAQEILQKITDFDLESLPFFHFKEDVVVAGVSTLISRTGYTGEDGFEIYFGNDDAEKIWDALFEAGEGVLKPAGLGCRDTLRFEAGLPLYGNELDDKTSPLEAGFGIFVSKEGDFIGSDVMKAQRAGELNKKLVGLELVDRGIARHGYPVYDLEENEIGVVTTGYKSPSLNKVIANAIINKDGPSLDDEVLIGVRKKKVRAKVINKYYLRKNTKK